MFARVSTFQGKPENLEKEIQVVRDEIIPKARSFKGFKGFRMLADRKTRKSLGVTFFARWSNISKISMRIRFHNLKLAPVRSTASNWIRVATLLAKSSVQ